VKPAERIPLLKKLAQALADLNDWEEIDLVLSEHSIDTSHGTRSDAYRWVLSKLKTWADDDTLLELERYFAPSGETSATPPVLTDDAGVWKANRFRLFISHTHLNAAFAGKIKARLGRYLIDSFVAHADLKPSVEWQGTIEKSLLSCQAAVALVTPDFHDSQWCDQEIGYCLARGILVVPIMRGAAPRGFLGKYQAMQVKESQSALFVADRLFEVLATRPETQAHMAASIVQRYAKSESFESTRESYALLRQLPKEAWTMALIAKAELAANSNEQISKAYTRGGKASIPEQLKSHLGPIEEYRRSIGDDIPF
jgi:hypothetical protein